MRPYRLRDAVRAIGTTEAAVRQWLNSGKVTIDHGYGEGWATFTLRDMNGVDTVVRLSDATSVKTNGGFLRGGTNYAQTNILRGLNLEVEGRGNGSGEIAAEKIRFSDAKILL